jgi:plasmid stabilization system protein ParE
VGDRKAGGGALARAARRCIAAAAVAVEQAAAMRARGVGSRMDEKQQRFEKKVRTMIFYFYFHADGAVRALRPTNTRSDVTDVLATALSLHNSRFAL